MDNIGFPQEDKYDGAAPTYYESVIVWSQPRHIFMFSYRFSQHAGAHPEAVERRLADGAQAIGGLAEVAVLLRVVV